LIVEHDELLKSLTADIMEDAGFAALQAGMPTKLWPFWNPGRILP